MKSEERHELQKNDLASWVYTIPHYAKEYGSYVLLAAALVLLGWQLWRTYEAKQAVALQNAWNKLAEETAPNVDNSPAKLQALIGEYDIRPVQAEAYLAIGMFYHNAVLLGNPEDGYRGVKNSREESLRKAAEAFKKVISDYSDLPLPVAKAYLQLGAVEESRGDWAAAKAAYAKLTAASSPHTKSAFADEARFRENNLKNIESPVTFGAATSQPATATAPARFELPELTGPGTAPATAPATQK